MSAKKEIRKKFLEEEMKKNLLRRVSNHSFVPSLEQSSTIIISFLIFVVYLNKFPKIFCKKFISLKTGIIMDKFIYKKIVNEADFF